MKSKPSSAPDSSQETQACARSSQTGGGSRQRRRQPQRRPGGGSRFQRSPGGLIWDWLKPFCLRHNTIVNSEEGAARIGICKCAFACTCLLICQCILHDHHMHMHYAAAYHYAYACVQSNAGLCHVQRRNQCVQTLAYRLIEEQLAIFIFDIMPKPWNLPDFSFLRC